MNVEKSIAALETLALGEPWSELAAAAQATLDQARAIAEAKVFPLELAPTTADAIAQYAWHTERLTAAGYAAGLAALHARALTSHPELARLLRSHDALADVGEAAARFAAPSNNHESHAAAAARAIADARARYVNAIAHQLVASKDELAPAARALLALDLAARLDAAIERHREHARAELERADLERKAAARAVIDRTAQRVRAAELRAVDAASMAGITAAEYRQVRAEAFAERLRVLGVKELRIGGSLQSPSELLSVDGLLAGGTAWSLQQLDKFEAALARQEAAA